MGVLKYIYLTNIVNISTNKFSLLLINVTISKTCEIQGWCGVFTCLRANPRRKQRAYHGNRNAKTEYS